MATEEKPKKKTRRKKKVVAPTMIRIECDADLGWVCVCSDGGRRKVTGIKKLSGYRLELTFNHPEDGFHHIHTLGVTAEQWGVCA